MSRPWRVTRAALHHALWVAAVGAAPSHAETLLLRINGVPVQVEHARGADAQRLAARRGEGLSERNGSMRGDWRLSSSLESGRSRVLQRRGAGESSEAIYSEIDTHAAPHPAPAPPFALPPGTRLRSTVEALGPIPSIQWIGDAAMDARTTDSWLRRAAELAGWRTSESAAGALTFGREGRRLRVVIRDVPGGVEVLLLAWGAE